MMDEDIEDIKKLEQVLKTETENEGIEHEDYDDLLNYSISDDEEQLEDFDSDGSNADFEEVDIDHIDAAVSTTFAVNTSNFHSDINAVKYYLTQEEIKVINSCKDQKLKRLLMLNRARNVQLKNLQCKLFEALRKSTALIKETEDKMKNYWKQSEYPGKSIIPRLGYPYFKTKDGYSSKPNGDLVKKRANKEISLDYLPLVTRWTLEDQVILKRAVMFQQLNFAIGKLENKLKELCNAKKEVTDEEACAIIEKTIMRTQIELNDLKDNGNVEPPPLNHCDGINWRQISSVDLSGRHSHSSCKAFWNISVHPSINKSNWTDLENEHIRSKAESCNYQNWDAIAAYLNNNRTGFAVCVHYYSTLCDKFRKDKWDVEEDEYLLEVVEFCRISNYIPWTKVAHFFDTRAKCQIYHRYKYHLLYNDLKKGTFSEAEDVLLLCLIRKFGPLYNTIVTYIPDRSPAQLSHRYNNYLRFDNMRLGQWTANEDRLILNHVSNYGEKGWSKLALLMSGRNRTHVRQRYLILKKWLGSNPDKTTDEMVRKTHIYKHNDALKLVRETAEYFNSFNTIPTIEAIEKKLNLSEPRLLIKYEKKVINNFVDSELIDFFKNTCKIKSSKIFHNDSLDHIVALLRILLNTLDVHLEYSIDGVMTNQSLDTLDKEVLNRLRSQDTILTAPSTSKSNNSNQNSTKYKAIPPNINTLIGFRSMLITHNSYKSKIQMAMGQSNFASARTQVMIGVKQELSQVNDRNRAQLLVERKTFEQRFQTLFKWPAIMSVMEPEENLNLLTAQPMRPLPLLPLKPGRPRKNLTKITLMNEARRKRRSVIKSHLDSNVKQSDLVLKDPLAIDESNKSDPPKPVNFYIHSVKTNDINGYMQRFKAKNGNVKVLVKQVNPSDVVLPQPHHSLFLKDISCDDDATDARVEKDVNSRVGSSEFPVCSESKINLDVKRQYGRKRTNVENLPIDAKKIKCEVDNTEDEFEDLRDDISKLNEALLFAKTY